MRIIITEDQYNVILNENLSYDQIFRKTIKGYESTVVDKSGSHYVFDDKDPKTPKTFIRSAKDKKGGTLTIGWGHTGGSAKMGNKISNGNAETLLSQDITNEENKTKRLFTSYDKYPLYVQRALVNSVYRGEGKSSYGWVKAVNANDWELASKKYLEGWNIDFKQASDPRYKGGVADRMVTNQKAFKQYANEIKTKPKNTSVNYKQTNSNFVFSMFLLVSEPILVNVFLLGTLKPIMSKKYNGKLGNNIITIDGKNIPKGTYNVNASSNNKFINKIWIK